MDGPEAEREPEKVSNGAGFAIALSLGLLALMALGTADSVASVDNTQASFMASTVTTGVTGKVYAPRNAMGKTAPVAFGKPGSPSASHALKYNVRTNNHKQELSGPETSEPLSQGAAQADKEEADKEEPGKEEAGKPGKEEPTKPGKGSQFDEAEIAAMYDQRRASKAEAKKDVNILTGALEEAQLIVWPSIGEAVMNTFVVLGGLVVTTVVLFGVNSGLSTASNWFYSRNDAEKAAKKATKPPASPESPAVAAPAPAVKAEPSISSTL